MEIREYRVGGCLVVCVFGGLFEGGKKVEKSFDRVLFLLFGRITWHSVCDDLVVVCWWF